MSSKAAGNGRRKPVSRDLYRATARTAGSADPAGRRTLKRNRARTRADLVVSALLVVVGIGFALAAGSTLAQTLSGIGDAASNALPKTVEGTTVLTLPEIQGNVSPAPIADGLPPFVNRSAFLFNGHVPTFAIGNGRVVDIALNGNKLQTSGMDSAGKFGAPMILREGPNTITATLMDKETAVAQASFTVVLKTSAPALTIVRPKDKEELSGPNIIVEGRAEARATVTINGHIVSANPDGAFSDTIPVTPGPLPLTILARDEAGNERTVKLNVTIKPPATAAPGPTLTVSLDRISVKPGEIVSADVYLTDKGTFKADAYVTLQVGVFVVGTEKTDSTGHAHFGFAAPTTEGEIKVVVLGPGASGSATLTVGIPKP